MKFTALKNRNVFIDDVLDGKASYDDLNEILSNGTRVVVMVV